MALDGATIASRVSADPGGGQTIWQNPLVVLWGSSMGTRETSLVPCAKEKKIKVVLDANLLLKSKELSKAEGLRFFVQNVRINVTFFLFPS